MRGNRVFPLGPKNADVLTGERLTHYVSSTAMKLIFKVLIVLAGLFTSCLRWGLSRGWCQTG
jgi:hypothetical protein